MKKLLLVFAAYLLLMTSFCFSGISAVEAKPGYPYASEGVDPWGFYKLNCTSYAAWAVNDDGLAFSNNMTGPSGSGHFGNAGNWNNNATAIGYSAGGTAHTGDVAVLEAFSGGAGSVGHVAYVETMNGNGTANISEYNWGSAVLSYNTRNSVTFDSYINFGQSLGTSTDSDYYRPRSGDFNGDGETDLALVRDESVDTQKWYVALSDGVDGFDSSTVWAPDFGKRGDQWFVGDFNGDGNDDLSLVRNVDSDTQTFYVALSDGVDGFNSSTVWTSDFGDDGDVWYAGDFDGDGDDDMALVRDESITQQKWYVALSNGSNGFASSTVWADNFGDRGDQFYVGNFNGDSDEDLALVRSVDSETQKWYVALSNGVDGFNGSTVWANDFGREGDLWFVGDFNNDGDEDLAARRDETAEIQKFYVALSNGTDTFASSTVWAANFGDRGDKWFVGDFNGSAGDDLALVRDVSSTTQTWYVALSDGVDGFDGSTVWTNDFGNRGDKFF